MAGPPTKMQNPVRKNIILERDDFNLFYGKYGRYWLDTIRELIKRHNANFGGEIITQCIQCYKKYYAYNEDAGTYKEHFCSRQCEIDYNEKLDKIANYELQEQSNTADFEKVSHI